MIKPVFGFPIRSDTNQAVQPQKMAWNIGFRKKRDCTLCVAKTKALISCAVTAQLICGFFFAYVKHWVSQYVAQMFTIQP